MAFDPYSGDLWETENGDDAFSELNRVEAGMNGGSIKSSARKIASSNSGTSK